jgi:hypothetical protein
MKKLINEVTFSLPCRNFTINYSVTERRQLPVVKEFVVRLIYEVESSYPDAIANYFGFNSFEIKEVLEDLLDEGLIQWNEGKVILSSYAQENFTEVNGNSVPRFFEITDITDTVTYDLFLFKFLGNGIGKIPDKFISIDIPLPSESFENVIKQVKSGFHAQFMHYQEQVKEIDILSEDSLELYKINHIESSRDQLIPIPVSYYFNDTTQSISVEYDLPAITEWDKDRLLFNTIDNAIEMASFDELAHINDCITYVGSIQDPFFIKVINDNEDYSNFKVPFTALLEHYLNNNSMKKGQQMIMGNLYTKDNQEILNKMIKRASKKSKNYSKGALLFANLDEKTWGKTRSLLNLVEIVSQTFSDPEYEFVINTPCDNKNKDEVFSIQSKYEISGAKLHSCGNIFNSAQIELLIIPDILVASLFHYKIEDNRELSLPIGFVSTDSDSIERITKEAKRWSNTSQAKFSETDIFQKKEKSIRDKFVLPILSYYEDSEKTERQKIIDKETSIKRTEINDE